MMKILIAGDYCPIGRTKDYLRNKDFENLFNGFEKIINNVDYSIINFECPFTTSQKPIIKTGPCLKTEDINAFQALKFLKFDMLTLANNHIQDYGSEGVLDTISTAKEYNFDIIGAGENHSKARSFLIKEIKTKKIGFINIAENEFCKATNSKAGAYTYDLIDNLKLIHELRPLVDKIILIYHGGREHYQLPSPELRKRFRFFIDQKVDAVVAHHTHCFSGFEYYKNKPIVYGLGNFLFDYKKKYQKGKWTEGMSVILNLGNDHFKIETIPHYQGRRHDSTFQVMDEDEKNIFNEKIKKLNKIIINDELFYKEWKMYLKTQEKFYLSSLYVRNLYIRALFIKGLLPIRLLKNKHNKLILNLMRCEAHHEITQEILEND